MNKSPIFENPDFPAPSDCLRWSSKARRSRSRPTSRPPCALQHWLRGAGVEIWAERDCAASGDRLTAFDMNVHAEVCADFALTLSRFRVNVTEPPSKKIK